MTNPNDINLDPATVEAAMEHLEAKSTVAQKHGASGIMVDSESLRILLAVLSTRDEAEEAMRTLEGMLNRRPQSVCLIHFPASALTGKPERYIATSFGEAVADTLTEAIKNLAHQLKGDQ